MDTKENIESARKSRRDWYHRNKEHAKGQVKRYRKEQGQWFKEYKSTTPCAFCNRIGINHFVQSDLTIVAINSTCSKETILDEINGLIATCKPCLMEKLGKCQAREERIKSQLGMAHGTACHRLRKKIMYDMAWKLGLTICYRCGTNIANEKELSIDHKENWENISPDLFWDLDNIAFSHHSCNVSA